jgi:branched-chain amino acid aminotransferase
MTTRIVEADWIWRDGEFVPWREASVHILSLAVQFGASVFEGIRCYSTPAGPALFRLREHVRRLFDSCRVYRMQPAHGPDDIAAACLATVARNGLDAGYVRPMVLRGYGSAGMNPVHSPTETWICAFPWGTYLGDGALEAGVDVCVSSWQRPEPNTFPSLAKGAGHYNNAMLIKMEALANGFAEAIALGPGGLVSEGSGQNLFLVRDGTLITPNVDGTLLDGITRDAVIALARDEGIPIEARPVPREMLYGADEVFLTGTAAEITPVRSIDRIVVGSGRAGPVTRRLQQRFLAVAHGAAPDAHGWLTPVAPAQAAPAQQKQMARSSTNG